MKRKYGSKTNEWEIIELTGTFLHQLTNSTIFVLGVTLDVLLLEDKLELRAFFLWHNSNEPGGVYSDES